MERLILFCFFSGFLFGSVKAQSPLWQWVNTVTTSGNEQAWDVCVDTSSGNVYSCGSFNGNLGTVLGPGFISSGLKDGFVVKYNSTGTLLWAFRLGGSGEDEIKSICTDPSGNFYITGYFSGTVDFDPAITTAYSLTASGSTAPDGFLAKYNSAGGFLWAIKFGSNASGSKVFADNNGVYLTGRNQGISVFYSTNSVTLATAATQAQDNFFGSKYNANGVAQWVVSGGGSGNDVGENVKADGSKVYFIGSYFANITIYNASAVASATLPAPTGNKSNVFILAYSQTGNLSWATNACSVDDDYGYGLTTDSANVMITGGFRNDLLNFPFPSPTFTLANAGGFDIYVATLSKATGSFVSISSSTGSGPGDEIGICIEKSADGSLVLAGTYRNSLNYSAQGGTIITSQGNDDVFVASYNSSGVFSWAVTGGGGNIDKPYGLAIGSTGAVYVAGEYATNSVFGTISLVSLPGKNTFVGKTGCETVANNTISASQTVCIGSSPASFTGSLPSGVTGPYTYAWQQSSNSLTWTAAAGTGTLQNYSPPTASSVIYYRRLLIVGAACVYPSNTLTIIIDSLPGSAVAGGSQTICATSATLGANPPLIGSGNWSVLSGGAVVTTPSSYSSAVTSLGPGLNIFLWSVSNGVCPPSTSTVSVTRDVMPTVASAGGNQSVCASGTTLAANVPVTGTGSWSVASGPATLAQAGNPLTAVNGLVFGQNVFVWTISNGLCPPSASSVVITRYEIPTASQAGSSQTLCAAMATLAASAPSVGTGNWSVLSGSASVASPSSHTATAVGLSVGQNIFEWTITNGTCPPSVSTVAINRDAMPSKADAGTDRAVCSPEGYLNALPPDTGTGFWSVPSGSAQVTVVNSPSTAVSGMTVGLNLFVWTVTNGVCPASSDTLIINRDAVPDPAVAGKNQTLCAESATLSAGKPGTGKGAWSLLSGGGMVVPADSAVALAKALSTGLNVFAWTVRNGVCPASIATVAVQRDAHPDASDAGKDQVVCMPQATMAANKPFTGKGHWQLLTGRAVFVDSVSAASVVRLYSDSVLLQWTISNGSCPLSKAEVKIVRDSVMPVIDAGEDQETELIKASLQATIVSRFTGRWEVKEGSAVIQDPGNPRTAVFALSEGRNVFSWKVERGECEPVSDEIIVFVKPFLVPNALSPNNDGYNDVYYIQGLENYDNVRLQIFNRWGGLVYSDYNYKNNWNGVNSNNELLADDTYYYVLEIPGRKNYSGFIILKRNR